MIRMPVPAPLEPMARTTEDAAAHAAQRDRYEQILRDREHAGDMAIESREVEAQHARERENEDRHTRAAIAIADRLGHATRARMTTWGVGSYAAVVAGFALGGPVGGVLALGAMCAAARMVQP
jgi:predicted phage tail protein